MVADVASKLYYEENFDKKERSIIKLQKCMERAMEQVCNNHHSTFCKHLLVCDATVGLSFLKEI
jgi:hypothetical protein